MQAARTFRRTLQGLCLAVLVVCPLASKAQPADPTPDTENWMVNDAEVVVLVNVKQMLASDIVKKEGGIEAIKGAIAGNEQAKAVFEATGIDPLKDINTILLSGTAASPKDVKALVVVRGKFDLDKIHSAAEKFAKKHPDELKLTKSGTINLYEVKGKDQTGYAAFVDGGALVVTTNKDATVEAVKNVGKKPAKMNKELKGAMTRFDGKESMAMALVVTEEMKKALGKLPQTAEVAPKLQTLTGTIKLTDAAATDLTINTEDAKAAAKLEVTLKQLKSLAELMVLNNEEVGPVASKVLEQVKINTTKNSVSINLKLTKDLIEKAGKKDKDKEKDKDK